MTDRTPSEVLAEIMDRCVNKIKQSEMVTQEFAKQLLDNADYHFGWADRAMQAAATERVHFVTLEGMRMGLEAKKNPVDILANAKRYALEQALRYAQHPERSTSMSSNAMSQFRGVAWAEMNEYLTPF